ncbi:uncharacterized protein L969DRAFT_605585 [Mixia osmundae IAM 14324]|uniref:Aspartate--tRNA ligase, cytoplasmic n=1 Tax=Mixia osmundae (strain CBS 9802 / IAM 14324 / JCM 22182 / KY 12970) TaxID=764103 RepID=G7DZZ8_MIXOS|nr:uncharacterized protein L969DRAFT_605585 [Mixia osmundae IAM 14324]KEI42150.1 hypothetical protein L969DRAFT_605585 [Mixia osmundae IAM 14324]GAA96158.1 hypothetical protein E5Q_02819 [Mixia osmundae IAM 14324]
MFAVASIGYWLVIQTILDRSARLFASSSGRQTCMLCGCSRAARTTHRLTVRANSLCNPSAARLRPRLPSTLDIEQKSQSLSTSSFLTTTRPIQLSQSNRSLSSSNVIMSSSIEPSAAPEPASTANQSNAPESQVDGESKGPSKSELKKKAKEMEKERKKAEREAKEAEARQAREAADVDFAQDNYGKLPLNQSQTRPGESYTHVGKLTANNDGQEVLFRARVHTTRAQGAKMVFVTFRLTEESGQEMIQGIANVEPKFVSKHMVKHLQLLPKETIVLVRGRVQLPIEPVKSCTVQDAEIKIAQLHTIAEPSKELPFSLDDACRSAAELERPDSEFNVVHAPTRLDSRLFDLRSHTNLSIFKINSAICRLFRDYLTSKNFIEIHTPKMQGAATESGSSVFKVDYFKRPAFLAQSPQLAKQMCIAADMERVFEIGPVFRAENSNTARHMTEFTGLDLEMTFNEHYHEVVDLLDEMLKFIFTSLQKDLRKEIDDVRAQYPSEDFVFPEETVKLPFHEGVRLLREDGWKDNGQEIGDYDDFSTPTEKRLGEIVKAKFNTDYYILDKFPLAVRPFYTMPDGQDPKLSNSYDFFMRGEEILSGAQRVHTADLLESRMREVGIDPKEMEEYVDGFRWGTPPHAGGGIGLERVLMLFLKLGNIRWASLFHRDPKSFPVPSTQTEAAAEHAAVHPPKPLS